MAQRPAWTIKNGKVVCQNFSFEWNPGFAVSQKQKNIKNLHDAIKVPALEISTKSMNPLGAKLSAFNLKLDENTLENVFQSSKVYENGGPYLDLLTVSAKEAKRDERHKTSGKLIGFLYQGEIWQLSPKTAFYDYIYCKAVVESGIDLSGLEKFGFFTDIEFNPSKSVNCQARTVAILKLLWEVSFLEVLNDVEKWIDFHKKCIVG